MSWLYSTTSATITYTYLEPSPGYTLRRPYFDLFTVLNYSQISVNASSLKDIQIIAEQYMLNRANKAAHDWQCQRTT